MTRGIVWLATLVAGTSTLVVLLLALVFVPVSAWETFVPLATVAGVVLVLLATLAAHAVARWVTGPIQSIVWAVERDAQPGAGLDPDTYPPEELAPLVAALRVARARLRDTVVQLEHDRAQLATILEHMADGVLVLDGQERVEMSNPAARRMLRAGDPHGRPLIEVARDAEVVDAVRSARTHAPVVRMVEVVRPSPAARSWLQVIATRLPERRRTLVLLQDVSDLRRAELARRDFVANVSHELRTPIAALKALAETLEAGAMRDPQAGPDFLRRIHLEVDGLAHLVTELLELARVEAGRTTLDLGPCAADELVHDAVDRMRPYAERTGLAVTTAVAADESMNVIADAHRTGQVLANLLSNAVKFTPVGGSIEVGARPSGIGVELWVRDTGCGIAPENLLRVFERFYKTDPSRAGSGTGLGLAISKHLVRAQGGEIWAESDGEGRGATFRFTLPRASATTGSIRAD